MEKIHIILLTWSIYGNSMDSMMNQKDIANYFKSKYDTKIDQSMVSRFLCGKAQVSWSFANDLSKEFPYLTIHQWKNATSDDIKRAFSQIKYKKIKKG